MNDYNLGVPRLLMDCDPGIDDAIALLMIGELRRRDSIRLDIVTTVGGNVPVDQTTRNACFVLDRDGDDQTPVFAGAGQSLGGPGEHVDATRFHGPDGLGSCYEPDHRPPKGIGEASEEIRRRLQPEVGSEPCWILATGPLTNLAMALREDSKFVPTAERVIVLGGALGQPGGNVRPWAEYNFYCDSIAAAEVLTSGLPIELVPLDVTTRVIIEEQDAEELKDEGATLASRLLKASISSHRLALGLDGCYMHDALAVAVLADPTIVRTRPLMLSVATNGNHRGHLAACEPTNQHADFPTVAFDVDAARAKRAILDMLSSSDT